MSAAMIASKRRLGKTRKTSKNIWGQLADVCGKIREHLYVNHDKRSARRFQRRLELIMKQLPENDLAIIRQEGAALLSELKDDLQSAIAHRMKEIELTERLHKSVQESVNRGEYDSKMAASILEYRDAKGLKQRRAIVRSLEEQRHAFQRDGVSKMRSEPEKRRRQ